MRREVFEKRGGYMNVGEAPGVNAVRNEYITDPANKELDMLFLFDHVGIDQGDSKWDIVKFDVRHLREQLKAQQEAVHDRGWASLFGSRRCRDPSTSSSCRTRLCARPDSPS